MTQKNEAAHHESTTEFLPNRESAATVELTNSSPGDIQATLDTTTPPTTTPNSPFPSIAGFQITSEIAKGGMGRIYAAHDLTLDREVAIKTLLPGANADRFLTEAQITAKLPHPCIPPVHALGTLADGTPYLAMKFIRGKTLAEEIIDRGDIKLELPRYLQIFEQIAQAVGFAHSRRIIHRDLKPLNIMVGEFGEVQVMDWGLAKELAHPLKAASETSENIATSSNLDYTLAGSVMGTPGYMAPEQARGETVDARADVFSLGATLIAILTGRPAFAGSTVRESLEMAARANLNETYSRLEECGVDAELIALAKRCVSPNPDTRLNNAQIVAQEIAAYRANIAIRLRDADLEKAAAAAREREYAKRRMQWIMAAAIVMLSLSIGLTASLWQMQRAVAAERLATINAVEARRERDQKEGLRLAEQQRAEGERQAKEEAQRNLDYARKGNAILGSVFTSLDPNSQYETVADLRNTLKSNLTDAAKALDSSAINDPLEISELQSTLGMSLLGLGHADEASQLLQKSLAIRIAELGKNDPTTLGAMGNLAECYRLAGKLDQAAALNQETLGILQSTLGDTHRDTLTAMNNLAATYYAAGALEKALPLYEQTIELRQKHLAPDDADTLASVSNLAATYYSLGQLDKALPYFEQSLESAKRAQGAEHLDTLTITNNLAAVYFKAGRLDRAVALFEESLRLRRAKLGNSHPDTLSTMRNLGIAYTRDKRSDNAATVLLEFIETQKTLLPPDDPQLANYLAAVSTDLLVCEKYDKAEPLLRDALRIRQLTTPEDWSTFNTLSQLGEALLGQKKYTEAENPLLQGYEGLATHQNSIPPNAASRLSDAIDRLIAYYTATSQAEQIKKWNEIKLQHSNNSLK